MRESPNPKKIAQREALGRLIAEYEKRNGPVKNYPIDASGERHVSFNNSQKETAAQQFARVNAKRKAK